jgi:hypothetical protein
LIAVSFDPVDRDFVVEVSRARSKESLFGELEYDLAALHEQRDLAYDDAAQKQVLIDAAHAELTETKAAVADLQHKLVEAEHDREDVMAELTRMTQTKVWRWSRWPRQIYAAVGSRRPVGR